MYEWDFSVIPRNIDLLLLGLYGTIKVFLTAFAIGLPFGLVLALLRLSRNKIVSLSASLFIDFLRSTPALVLIFWFFFAFPILIGLMVQAFLAATLTLAIVAAAFYAEIFRAGIASIERGQWESALALGMTYTALMRRIILPQAVKRMIPAFLERTIELLKTTPLMAAVAYSDLLFQAMDIAQKTFRPLEVLTAVAGIYFLMIYPMSLGVRKLERHLAKSGESTVH
jgi:polar amino acid transport system permease protein